MKKAHVIGTKVSKSLSPIIFDYWFKKYNISAEYSFKEINEDIFDKEIKKILEDKNVCGFNVTIPFKEKIIKHINILDTHTKSIGAVNCVTKTDNGLEGTNTDFIGFEKSIRWQEENGVSKLEKKETALVIGYGGAAKAIIYSLIKTGFKKVRVFNRSFEKIQNLEGIYPHKIEEISNFFNVADIVINTIPVNYKNNIKLHKTKHAENKNTQPTTPHGYDICYNENTFFLKNIEHAKRFYGIHMLIHQAAPCFHRWFGVEPRADNNLVKQLLQYLKK